MGFGSVFSNAWDEFSSNFKSIFKFTLIYYLIPLIILWIIFAAVALSMGYPFSFVYDLWAGNGRIDFSWEAFPILAILSLVSLVMVIFSLFLYAGFYGLSVKKKEYSSKEITESAKKGFWRLLGRGILIGLSLIGLFILLIIPGIIFSIYWIFAVFIWFNEREKSFGQSLRSSRELVRGKWWRTLGNVILLMVIVLVVSLIFSVLPIIGKLASVFISIFSLYFMRHLYIEYSSKKQKR